ncbi:RNA exonuclease 1 [Dendrobium catenatum]|uniref:RNA exonuclease 1 n=1 Tax=Dendrobium catenatum TaxID=906689 RepID=A0A2I0WZQ5_9ASPA|nr:RNA exonuclease 1 [Dendrobium catenatum]
MATSHLVFPPLPNSSLPGPSPGGLSYAENVSASTYKAPIFPVSFFSPSSKLSFKADDLTEGKSIWTTTLIGYSLGPRPYYERLLKAMQKIWNLKGSMTLLSLADGFFLLKFSTSEDLEMVLSGGPWFILGKPFILQRWSPKFKPKRDEDAPIPIWIKIVDFPLALWTPTGISKISSFVGIPISVDNLTANRTRLTFARVCVLITKDSVLPDEIPIEIEGEDLVLKVLYEWKPEKCEGCGSLIHPFSLCPKNLNPQPFIPPQPPKFRGRSRSRPHSSRPHRPSSTKPPPKVTNLLPPKPIINSDIPKTTNVQNQQPSPGKNPVLPNLNSPTEDAFSSGKPVSPTLLQPPIVPLLNKFASLQTEDQNIEDTQEFTSESESASCSNTAKEPPTTTIHEKVVHNTRSNVDKGKSPNKSKPSKGKSAKKAKPQMQ